MTAFHFFLGVTFIVSAVCVFAELYDLYGKRD
jgi:hypothetical protein